MITLADLLPDAPPEIQVDWLQEQGATLADVLALYAGTPPKYLDGLPQDVLAAWCKTTEPGALAPRASKPDDVLRAPVREEVPRWKAVGSLRAVPVGTPLPSQRAVVWELHYQGRRGRPRRIDTLPDKGSAARALKRAVLGLFPEIKIEVGTSRLGRFRYNVRAPHVIPPEGQFVPFHFQNFDECTEMGEEDYRRMMGESQHRQL